MIPFVELKATTKITWKPGSIRRPSTKAKDKAPVEKIKKPDNAPGMINGQKAHSSYEWNVARALWALDWNFSYQIPVMGGREVMGGQVLDFLIKTVPLKTALIVNGDYWHQTDEEYKISELMSSLAGEGISVNTEPLILWMAQASTFEAAYSYINSQIGKG